MCFESAVCLSRFPDRAALLCQCNGEKRLGDLIQGMAAARGVAFAEMAPSLLGTIQRLLSRGFLTVNHVASETFIAAAPAVATAEPIVVTAGAHLA